jgi:predicted ATPase
LVMNLKQQNPDSFEFWVDHVKVALPNLEAIAAVEREEDHHAYLKLDYCSGYSVTSSGLSDGTLHILALTIIPYLSNPPGLISLEEPENGIYPRAIELVLQSLSSVENTQVWLSTHSPIVLANTELDALVVMRSAKDGRVEAISGTEHPRLKDWQAAIDLGSLFAAGVLS